MNLIQKLLGLRIYKFTFINSRMDYIEDYEIIYAKNEDKAWEVFNNEHPFALNVVISETNNENE